MQTETKGNLTTVCDNAGQVMLATSYGTCILTRRAGVAVFNATKYSVTTTRHQNVVRGMLDYDNVITLDDCPRGIDSDALLERVGL